MNSKLDYVYHALLTFFQRKGVNVLMLSTLFLVTAYSEYKIRMMVDKLTEVEQLLEGSTVPAIVLTDDTMALKVKLKECEESKYLNILKGF